MQLAEVGQSRRPICQIYLIELPRSADVFSADATSQYGRNVSLRPKILGFQGLWTIDAIRSEYSL